MSEYTDLLKKNPDYKILEASSKDFAPYGKIYANYDLSELKDFMKSISIDKNANLYVPSNKEIEALPVIKEIGRDVYAGMDIEAGECSGQTLNFTAVEFHQGSEVNITLTPVVMVLAKRYQLEKTGKFDAKKDAKLFYIPAGTVFEMYSDTLHYSPIKVNSEGFKVIVMLLKGSNTDLPKDFVTNNPWIVKKNKFQVVHASRQDKIKLGIQVGVTGELIELQPLD